MHSINTVKYKYPGAETCNSFVFVNGLYFMILCIGRVYGLMYLTVMAGFRECNIAVEQLVGAQRHKLEGGVCHWNFSMT
jgi:hypothetical protein